MIQYNEQWSMIYCLRSGENPFGENRDQLESELQTMEDKPASSFDEARNEISLWSPVVAVTDIIETITDLNEYESDGCGVLVTHRSHHGPKPWCSYEERLVAVTKDDVVIQIFALDHNAIARWVTT